ncbi:MAG: hypothetical protein A2015_05955 [Spirochaetes bacterium GWF1_31_7]|nr:MAG: hypothetical protein A2Y30_07755 [Spirochaetes bacterium GWE1_32_154]OHD50801.1 MAG: hypothetical protein A2Y29_02585 [Spirochaetes bacterium GWE2_31_10]OHD52738.1 MAG: hypothetical protein A2015_05955 [Spirochaetes bacterium GWF1_31_7]OHD78548.1 MAG: hypothetical protein A2355_15910 [Spirochaetes bacterium RIFOXYB1_FULL_32_8]HBD95413.1 iron-sulfur protein [Spirochaetia bacterium]
MKIIILNGSPKGEYSVSYQYTNYWQKKDTDNLFMTFHIGTLIHTIDSNDNELYKIIDEIKSADCIIWVYPVYTSLIPYQLMRFIEIIIEKGLFDAFKDKFTSQIVTSRHFYDHTAYNYLKQICEEWGMKTIPGHLADMEDLLKKEGQKRLDDFIKEVDWMTHYDEIKDLHTTKDKSKRNVVSIITNSTHEDISLNNMITWYSENVDAEVQILNLNDILLKSGCLGCLHCTIEGRCVIKDDFQESFVKFFKDSDAIIYAATIKNHWFGSIWKQFDDRQFSNGHRISLMGRPVGYLISGKLSEEPNLLHVIESRVEVGHVYLLDIISDEKDSVTVSESIKKMALKTSWAFENAPERPVNFLGVGGMRVFRDLIYVMRGMMQEDHKFYKQHNLYDFPQKKKFATFQAYLIGFMMKSKKIRGKIIPQLKQMMLKPYQKVIDRIMK